MRRFLRQAAVVWLTVLVLAVTAFVPQGGIHASGAISVADAIANNEGAATVEGYIVGTTNTTSSFSTGQFDAPFSVRTNLLLADDPAEREKANLLPVQLPNTAIRGQLNLADNPGNLGKKVRISGDLGAYFSVPGLRNASSFTWAEGSDEPLQPVTITEARASIGSRVITEGVVNVDNGVLHPGKLSVYMQDGEAGIQLFSHNPDPYPEVKKGDRVRVEGSVSQYNGVTQVLVDELEVLAQNQAVETKAVTIEQYRDASAAEALEGQLVTLEGFVRNVPDYFNGGANLTVINEEFDPLVLRVWESTGIDLTLLKANHWYQVTGISSEYRGTYQVLPREQSDLTLSEVQKEKPSTDGREYVAEVERVVDGDTIRLKEPVLGSTNVRYLNIDTPETYHRVDNELDQNQMDHGKRATEYLETLLSPGDTVTLKLGEEPLDSYDRLLAEVVRED
ncbi:endonuclease, partial [Fischerella thermalis CCMEE 5273]